MAPAEGGARRDHLVGAEPDVADVEDRVGHRDAAPAPGQPAGVVAGRQIQDLELRPRQAAHPDIDPARDPLVETDVLTFRVLAQARQHRHERRSVVTGGGRRRDGQGERHDHPPGSGGSPGGDDDALLADRDGQPPAGVVERVGGQPCDDGAVLAVAKVADVQLQAERLRAVVHHGGLVAVGTARSGLVAEEAARVGLPAGGWPDPESRPVLGGVGGRRGGRGGWADEAQRQQGTREAQREGSNGQRGVSALCRG